MKETSVTKSLTVVAMITVLILAIPLVAMQFTTEVNWSVFDFIIMGALIFSSGFAYVMLTRYASTFIYRAAIASAVGITFLLIWVNLAVGLIGGGPNPGNFMYLVTIAVVIMGIIFSRFTSKGMERTMFAASLSIVLIAIIALLTHMNEYPGSSVKEIIGVNAFFAGLFSCSGLLFRQVSLNEMQKSTN